MSLYDQSISRRYLQKHGGLETDDEGSDDSPQYPWKYLTSFGRGGGADTEEALKQHLIDILKLDEEAHVVQGNIQFSGESFDDRETARFCGSVYRFQNDILEEFSFFLDDWTQVNDPHHTGGDWTEI